MPPLRLLFGALGAALTAACLRFEAGNPPKTTPEVKQRRLRVYPLGNHQALLVRNNDPNSVMLDLIGPCQTDLDAQEAAMVQEQIAEMVCGNRTHYQFHPTSPSSFELKAICREGRFQQLIQGICQLSPE